MVRFCVGREEEAGPSSSRQCPKRLKTEIVTPLSDLTDSDCEIGQEEDEDDREEEEEEDGYEEEAEEPEFGEDPDGPVSVTLTDPDVLDCPICLDPLSIPVFQCDHGHVACASCCPKIHMTCPSCSFPIGYNRCRAIEKVLESIMIACKNKRHGCRETMKYCDKHAHEDNCPYSPCSCPLPTCNFAATAVRLYVHFTTHHTSSSTQFCFNKLFSVTMEDAQRAVFLRDELSRVYVLNNFCEANENKVINIVQIGPPNNNNRLVYDLKATCEETSITLHSLVECIPSWEDCHPGKKALTVPSCYVTPTGQIHLKICIWRNGRSAAS